MKKNDKVLYVIVFILVQVFGIIVLTMANRQQNVNQETVLNKEIRYVPIGDSYTIGEGVSYTQNFPSLLTEHLNKEGYIATLVENPARSGLTSQDAITYELPIFESSNPNFATLLIGANDIVLHVNAGEFRKNIETLVDRMRAKLPDQKRLVVITIPDFSVTPAGKQLGIEKNLGVRINIFNEIIIDEAGKKGATIVDITPLSKRMENDPTLVLDDNLHPSAKEYQLWEGALFKDAVRALK